MRSHLINRSHPQLYSKGVSLIELMVALTIGLVLIAGAVKIYVDSKSSYDVNESVSRLQENARYAMSVIEPDIRMAGSWGLISDPQPITVVSPGAPIDCGNGFATTIGVPVQATNNGSTAFPCPLFVRSGGSGLAVLSADTITVRHATANATTATANTWQVCSTVIGATISTAIACTVGLDQHLNDLVANSYYVSRDSDQAVGTPSLRRKTLIAGPAFTDVEIIPNIEDLQIQFGVSSSANTANAVQYVNPGNAILTSGVQIVSVRVWLLVRAEAPEAGFTDMTPYQYGDRAVGNGITSNLNAANSATQAYQPNDGYRRLLISRTIQLRNAVSRSV